jgi:hypothetical protein
MILVKLTELPHPDCKDKNKYYQHLAEYKEAFIEEPKSFKNLMEHIADLLQRDQINKRHEDMIELIFVLFKNLLSIPDI